MNWFFCKKIKKRIHLWYNFCIKYRKKVINDKISKEIIKNKIIFKTKLKGGVILWNIV